MLLTEDFDHLPSANYVQKRGLWIAENRDTEHKIAVCHEDDLVRRIGSGIYLYQDKFDRSRNQSFEQYRLITSNLEIAIRPSTHDGVNPCVMENVSKEIKWVNFDIFQISLEPVDKNVVQLTAHIRAKEVVLK